MYCGKCWTAISRAFAVAAVTVGLAASSFGAGSETILHTFVNGSDGSLPFGGLTIDSKGNLLRHDRPGRFRSIRRGHSFQIDAEGQWRLYVPNHPHFLQGAGDGGNPAGSVVLDAAGNIGRVSMDRHTCRGPQDLHGGSRKSECRRGYCSLWGFPVRPRQERTGRRTAAGSTEDRIMNVCGAKEDVAGWLSCQN
jgi:hypothetical protein